MDIGAVFPQVETLSRVPRDDWGKELAAWHAMRGVTHMSVYTVGLGLRTPDEHVATLRQIRGLL
jgi:hypothetical protein